MSAPRLRPPRRPIFLAPAGYRRRRLRDAARLLPVFAAIFLILPMLWAPSAPDLRSTAWDGIYLFLVWIAAIAAAAALSGPLGKESEGVAPDPEDED